MLVTCRYLTERKDTISFVSWLTRLLGYDTCITCLLWPFIQPIMYHSPELKVVQWQHRMWREFNGHISPNLVQYWANMSRQKSQDQEILHLLRVGHRKGNYDLIVPFRQLVPKYSFKWMNSSTLWWWGMQSMLKSNKLIDWVICATVTLIDVEICHVSLSQTAKSPGSSGSVYW